MLLTAHNFTRCLVSNAKNWGEVCSQIVSVVYSGYLVPIIFRCVTESRNINTRLFHWNETSSRDNTIRVKTELSGNCVSRLTLRPRHLFYVMISRVFSPPETGRQWSKTTHFHLQPSLKWMGLYFHSRLCPRSVMLFTFILSKYVCFF